MKYPIIAIKEKDSFVYAFETQKDISITSEELLKTKIFDGVKFIDSNGNKFLIKSIIRKGWATFFFGFSLFKKGRQLRIDFIVEKIETLTLSDVRELIKSKVINNNFYKTDEIIRKIDTAVSFEDIYKIFY